MPMVLWLDTLLSHYVVIKCFIIGIWNGQFYYLINVLVTDVIVTRPDVISPFYLLCH